MPRYDYECEKCHHGFELKQSFDSEPIADCPVCQSVSRRQFHSVPIVFKGSGWYVNDYGKRSAGGTGSDSKDTSESKSKSEGDSSQATKDAAKSDTKSESKSSATSKSETNVGTAPAKADRK